MCLTCYLRNFRLDLITFFSARGCKCMDLRECDVLTKKLTHGWASNYGPYLDEIFKELEIQKRKCRKPKERSFSYCCPIDRKSLIRV